MADFDFEIDEKHKTVSITEQGVAKAERFLGIDHLYRAENGHLVNHLIQALRAESLYKSDVDYAVIDGEVKIIDEFTGRILEGRRWSEGLHQAIEAKEGVSVQEENQTLATITYQNYFRLYDKLAGMTGTALTEATEFMKIYELPVVQVPTNMQMVRDDRNDQIYKTKEGKWNAVVKEIAARHENGQPVLVGTISVEVSELLSERLTKRGIAHTRAERQARARRARGRDRRRGGPAGRRHDRDEHGRPRRGHQARRQPRASRPPAARQGRRGARGRRGVRAAHARGAGGRRTGCAGEPRTRDGGRRAVHLRHRAPRVAAHRQPAARALRAPGRPRREPLLPVGRGRPRAAVRRRPHLQDPRPTGRRRRGGQRGTDRGGDALQADRESPAEGRGAELPDPQTRARVRRRDERAASRDLRLPRRGARREEHRRGGPPAGRRGDRAHDRPVHAGGLHGGLGPRRAVHRAGPVLPARSRRRRPRPRDGRPGVADRSHHRAWRSSATTPASRRWARS